MKKLTTLEIQVVYVSSKRNFFHLLQIYSTICLSITKLLHPVTDLLLVGCPDTILGKNLEGDEPKEINDYRNGSWVDERGLTTSTKSSRNNWDYPFVI